MHNLTSVLENDTNKLILDFDIQTDHLISARKPELIIINKRKRTCEIIKELKEREKKDKYLDLARELKNYVR